MPVLLLCANSGHRAEASDGTLTHHGLGGCGMDDIYEGQYRLITGLHLTTCQVQPARLHQVFGML